MSDRPDEKYPNFDPNRIQKMYPNFDPTGFKKRLFEISFNVQDPMPEYKDREWQGPLTMENIKDLWKHSGCTEERCEEIINEWGQTNEWWGDGQIYFNYLFVRPIKQGT